MPVFRGVAKSRTIEVGPKRLRFHTSPSAHQDRCSP